MADLTTKKRKAIEALLVASNTREAAKLAALGERTIHRYLAGDGFRAELQARQDQILAGTTAALVGLTSEAIESLRASLAVLRDHLGADLGGFVWGADVSAVLHEFGAEFVGDRIDSEQQRLRGA